MRRTVLACAATTALLAGYACRSDVSNPSSGMPASSTTNSGSLAFDLDVAPGVSVNTVNYQITGDGFSPITGSVPLGAGTGNTFTAFINGIPAGTGRQITLTADASNGATCAGSATFDVLAGQATMVSVVLECRDSGGAVIVRGGFDQCPLISSLSAAPGSAPVGGTISLDAVARDPEGRPLSLTWSATAGTFADASALSTMYTCTAAGTQTITASVSETNGSCKDSVSFPVACTGAADAGGSGGADSGAGGAATGGTVNTGGAATGGVDAGTGGATGGTANTGGAATGGTANTGGAATGGTANTGGAATGGTANTGGAATGGSGGMGIDLSGTWISEIKTAGTEMVPVVGTTSANIDLVIRLAVTEAAGTLNGELDICRLNAVTTPNASSLVVTFTPTVLATLTGTGSESAFTATVGGAVPFPAITILSGVDASGGEVDADADGNPGVTIPSNIGGVLMVNAYVGLTIKTTLTSTLTDASTITGTTNFTTNGTVFGSNNPILTSGMISVTPSSSAVPFTATKLTGNVPCSQVLSHF